MEPIIYSQDIFVGKICEVCNDILNKDTYVLYQMMIHGEWYISKICKQCLNGIIEFNGLEMDKFKSNLTDLSKYSEILTKLVNGQTGFPVNISDLGLFPIPCNKTYPNTIDEKYGRPNEVFKLSVGLDKIIVDPHIQNAPDTKIELRIMLYNLILILEKKLVDNKYETKTEIQNLIDKLKIELFDQSIIYIKSLHHLAQIPLRQTMGSAGYDLFSIATHEIDPGQRKIIPTGIAITFASEYYARIAPRSGLAVKLGLDILAGVIDCDYCQEIKVVVINLGQSTIILESGSRIAQLIIERCHHFPLVSVSELPNPETRIGGFGSTGV